MRDYIGEHYRCHKGILGVYTIAHVGIRKMICGVLLKNCIGLTLEISLNYRQFVT